MKISDVAAWWVQMPIPDAKQHTSDFGRVRTFDALIVRVRTEEGLVGYGEGKNAAGSQGNYGALAHLVQTEIAPVLVGKNPLQIQKIWSDLYSGSRASLALKHGRVFPEMPRRGVNIAAMSAIDMALWDLLGKSLDTPLSQLLGGARMTHIPAYASGGWAPKEEIGEQLLGFLESTGCRAVKMRAGAMDRSVAASAERVLAARAALGSDVDLMCDVHGTLSPADAKRFCHLVADADLRWLEEPVSADDKWGLAEVRASTHIPIATGESEYTRFDFRDLIEVRGADVLQPDLAICGGVSEAIHIASLAASYNLQFVPHLWAGALAFAAGAALVSVSPAGSLLEYSVGANPMIHELIEEEVKPIDGEIAVPTGPGLGVTVRQDVIDRFKVSP